MYKNIEQMPFVLTDVLDKNKGDIIVADRAYSYVDQSDITVVTTKQLGKPDDHKKKQLTTTRNNSNKPVLWTRNVVEHAIGLYTMKFPRLRTPINLHFAGDIEQIIQIITAYFIEYYPPLRTNSEIKEEYAREMIRRIDEDRQNIHLKEMAKGKKGVTSWRYIGKNASRFQEWVKREKWLPIVEVEELVNLNCGTYQVERADTYIADSQKYLKFRLAHDDRYPDSEIIKVTNIRSKYRRGTTRTTIIEFKKKLIKKQKKRVRNNLYKYINWYCNCSAGSGTVTACSHVIMVLKLIHLQQKNKTIKQCKIHDKLFKKTMNCEGFNIWSFNNKQHCVCADESGVNVKTMLKCKGCRHWYHPRCIIDDEDEIKEVEKFIGKRSYYWCCKEACAYKRDKKLITEYNKFITKMEKMKKNKTIKNNLE